MTPQKKYNDRYYNKMWEEIINKYPLTAEIRDIGDLLRAKILKRFLNDFIKSNTQKRKIRIHDYGAGNWLYLGTIYQVVARYPSIDFEITGFDFTQSALEFGTKKFRNLKPSNIAIKTKEGDLLNSINKIETESVDCIISLETLEHLYNDKSVFANYSRVLKSRGIIIASVPNKKPFFLSENWFLYTFAKRDFIDKDKLVGHLRRYSVHSFKKLAQKTKVIYKDRYLYGFLLAGYLKKLISWGDQTLPKPFANLLFKTCLILISLEQKLYNLLKSKSSEGIFILFAKA